MSYLDFLVDFASRGEVMGLGLGSAPAEWANVLGDEFFEARHDDGRLSREFGMIDVNFENRAGTWSCFFIEFRVAQLQWPDEMIPGTVRAKYGAFPDRIAFEDVADRVARAGLPVYHLPKYREGDAERYWVDQGEAMFHVITGRHVEDYPGLHPGDIFSVGRMAGRSVRIEQYSRYR